MNALPGGMQVEKVLDDLIYRLANTDGSPEVRAALVEAKRLKSVTTRWAAIPPPPDARREMLARVMELISTVNSSAGATSARNGQPVNGQPLSVPPRNAHDRISAPPRHSAPPASARTERPISRREDRDTPVADAALPPEAVRSNAGSREPPAMRRTAPPPPPPAAFRRPTEPSAVAPEKRSSPAKPPPPRVPSSDAMRAVGSAQGAAAARSVAPTRRPPPSKRPTKPPPPTAQLPHASEQSEAIELSEMPRSSQKPAGRPLTLRPPGAPPPLPTTHPQPFTRTQSALPAADRHPIRAVPSGRVATLDGLSTSISSAQRHAVDEPAQERIAPLFPRAPTVELLMGVREVSSLICEGITLVRPDVTDWQPHPVAKGATLKLLYHDGQTGLYTALVRLAPATSFPARKHAAAEEMYLVSGTATVGEVEMRSGDYMRAAVGSAHPEIQSAGGCVFLISGSEHDEMATEDT